MNHIGTHDTERAITKIAGEKSDYRDRQWQSEHFLSEEEYKRGVKLLKLCAAIQYTLPGVPCVYYGDEAGMQGYKDPFNRAFFPWGRENRELQNYYIRLGKVRRSTDCLKEGEFIPVSSVLSCVCFERRGKNDSCLLIANRNEQDITYYLPPRWQNTSEVLLGESVGSSVLVPGLSAVILKKKLLDKSAYCGAGAAAAAIFVILRIILSAFCFLLTGTPGGSLRDASAFSRRVFSGNVLNFGSTKKSA